MLCCVAVLLRRAALPCCVYRAVLCFAALFRVVILRVVLRPVCCVMFAALRRVALPVLTEIITAI